MPKGDGLPSTQMKKVAVEPRELEMFEQFRQMPPCKKSDPAGLQERLTAYFKICHDFAITPTVESMVCAIGVSRAGINLWEHDETSEAGAIITRAKSVINACLTQATVNGKMPFPYAIWLQKNHFHYSDSPQVIEVKHTNAQEEELEQNLNESGLAWDAEVGDFVQV